jgi:hypothetical protein
LKIVVTELKVHSFSNIIYLIGKYNFAFCQRVFGCKKGWSKKNINKFK